MNAQKPSFLYSGNADYLEALYERYLDDPAAVTPEWRAYFESLPATGAAPDMPHSAIVREFTRHATAARPGAAGTAAASFQKQVSVLQLINAYRFRGHQQADLDPLRQYQRPAVAELDPAYHNLTPADLDSVFNPGSLVAPRDVTLREILDIVRTTYCGTIGAEYMHMNETEQKRWIQQRLEQCRARPGFSAEQRLRILERLIAANALEEYLHTKYVGQKRFSLEGGESLIPLLDEIVQGSGLHGAREIVIGMAHRGRLNVLVNIIGKLPHELFGEFEGKGRAEFSAGDVKYHLGYSSDIQTPGGVVHLTLSFNPSHLEIIDPVVEGSVRARQDRRLDRTRTEVVPVLIHGDAAFAGQGVVMETFQLSQTRGYSTGGTVHIIINNQIGFTTSDPLDSRSSLYCTDVAKMVQAPIFHVNGDDPEAVVFVAKLALDFRTEFKKDVVVDLVCFRRHGHSEADEPAATQPIMYRKIRSHPGVRALYAEKLAGESLVDQTRLADMAKRYVESLESNRAVAGTLATQVDTKYLINYAPYRGTRWDTPVNTGLDAASVRRLTERITTLPAHFKLHPTVERIVENRRRMGSGEMPMDWGYAENMAYAALVEQGVPVRLSGQDSGRGTFFHRHAVIHNANDGATHLPLQHIRPDQAPFLVINSTLSEEAVLAFEYGYASAAPNALVIWEAQFGDFANGAQVVFDQFISSCEAKWGRYCGLTVLLPHGYDGQGPEHSSARLERYLQLCAEENMQVCVPSTPAQMFHMLRRQALRPYRKPLIVMSPKSLLRHKLSTSPVESLIEGRFEVVIDEIDSLDRGAVTRLLFCTGKVYFDLLEARRKNKIGNIAIARIEQLFPFPQSEVKAVIARYPNLREVVWVQEEPKNQGSWYYMQSRGTMIGCLQDHLTFGYAGRFYSASPAVGYMQLHLQQQKQLVDDALELNKIEVTTHLRRA
jgi:2-oxoglutarate dehydrogenase E1 component